jgi:hypothetical protein
MDRYIIEVVARLASKKIRGSNPLYPHGKQQDIRKKPHAIDVALEQSIQRSCWYIM